VFFKHAVFICAKYHYEWPTRSSARVRCRCCLRTWHLKIKFYGVYFVRVFTIIGLFCDAFNIFAWTSTNIRLNRLNFVPTNYEMRPCSYIMSRGHYKFNIWYYIIYDITCACLSPCQQVPQWSIYSWRCSDKSPDHIQATWLFLKTPSASGVVVHMDLRSQQHTWTAQQSVQAKSIAYAHDLSVLKTISINLQ